METVIFSVGNVKNDTNSGEKGFGSSLEVTK